MDETRRLDDSDTQGQGQSGSYSTSGQSQSQGQSGGYAGQSQGQSGGNTNPNTQEFKLSGDDIMAKIKELVHEGNVRRITIKNEQGQNILEFPLTAGVIGVALLPVWAAIGAVMALAANCTIVVERRE
jgi:uncharacterized protein DUF4342